MKNVTRTMVKYRIRAYDLVKGEDGKPAVGVVCETVAEAASLTKSEARALLAPHYEGGKLPKGLTLDWEKVGTVTYAMPLEKYLEQAVVIGETDI